MDPGFWHERWARDEIGFHQHDYNRHMLEYTARMGLARGAHLFVPLCGKSLDMVWLADQGYRVAGFTTGPPWSPCPLRCGATTRGAWRIGPPRARPRCW